MSRFTLSVASFCFLVGMVLLLWPFVSLQHRTPLQSTGLVEVGYDGSISQNGQPVGQFERSGNQLEAILPLNADSQAVASADLLLAFPPSLIVSPGMVHLDSIAGTAGTQVNSTTNQQLHVLIPQLIPEAHTVVTVDLPPNSLALPWDGRLVSWLTHRTTLDFALVCLLLVCAALAYQGWRVRAAALPATQEEEATIPDDLNPVEMALLVRGRLRPVDISALFFSLGSRGLLEIMVHDPEHSSFMVKAAAEKIDIYELILLDLLWPDSGRRQSLETVLKTLNKHLFSKTISNMYTKLYEQLLARGYFAEDPRLSHLRLKTMAVLLQSFSLLWMVISYFAYLSTQPGLVLLGMAGYLLGSILYNSSYTVLHLTPQGQAVRRRCAAFQRYLGQTRPIGLEGNHGALFYHFLPYALVLDAAPQWLERFNWVSFYAPDWFASQIDQTVTPAQFVRQVGQVTSLFARVFVRVKDPDVE